MSEATPAALVATMLRYRDSIAEFEKSTDKSVKSLAGPLGSKLDGLRRRLDGLVWLEAEDARRLALPVAALVDLSDPPALGPGTPSS